MQSLSAKLWCWWFRLVIWQTRGASQLRQLGTCRQEGDHRAGRRGKEERGVGSCGHQCAPPEVYQQHVTPVRRQQEEGEDAPTISVRLPRTSRKRQGDGGLNSSARLPCAASRRRGWKGPTISLCLPFAAIRKRMEGGCLVQNSQKGVTGSIEF